MRGAPCSSKANQQPRRIIPADAGSTRPWRTCRYPHGDHPRGCGEHQVDQPGNRCQKGSSPRMRGAHAVIGPSDGHAGIIPADAGSTAAHLGGFFMPKDHPRGCGEHSGRRRERVTGTGSSPRMRGALEVSIIPGDVSRIIPADAGSTARPWGTAPRSRDHPRGCGEHGDEGMGFARVQGSSPRMRGARFFDLPACDAGRIIPADAGST